jgi:arginase family enzyme
MHAQRDKGVTVITAMDVHESSPAAIAARVREVVGSGPVYLSFDIDALDPAFAPGRVCVCACVCVCLSVCLSVCA